MGAGYSHKQGDVKIFAMLTLFDTVNFLRKVYLKFLLYFGYTEVINTYAFGTLSRDSFY